MQDVSAESEPNEFIQAVSQAMKYLDKADALERVYFLDNLNSNYCRFCGEKIFNYHGCECQIN